MNPIVHFEIPVNDLKRGADFYAKAFGWTIKPWKNDKMEYWSVLTKDAKGNGIDGGMMKRMNPGHAFCNYIAVEDIDSALAKVTANGGKTCMGKQEIAPGMGWIAMFTDTEGNMMGLHQPSAEMAASMKKSAPAAKKSPVKKSAAKKKK